MVGWGTVGVVLGSGATLRRPSSGVVVVSSSAVVGVAIGFLVGGAILFLRHPNVVFLSVRVLRCRALKRALMIFAACCSRFRSLCNVLVEYFFFLGT